MRLPIDPWITTASGRHLHYLDPQPDQIDIYDIAQALSREARFNGHTSVFYSVAQHSVCASDLVPWPMKLEALLHDATEAFMKDIPSPLKGLIPDYKKIEDRVDAAIRARFNLPATMSPEVKKADLIMLCTERRDLMPVDGSTWELLRDITPRKDISITSWAPGRAQAYFLRVFHALVEKGV